ncbi:MAG: hypothetical protein J5817_01380 [Treponema sp.]|nr:hypothetical protein [Treponema sp.]
MFKTKKKILLALSAIFICLCIPCAFSHDEKASDVSVYLKNGKECTKIFTGNIPRSNDISALLDQKLSENLTRMDKKIKCAKEITDNRIEKACIDDGEYFIEYLSEGKKYSVQNAYWMYDESSAKFYRCNILEELRGIYYSYSHKELISDYYKKNS